MALQLAGYYGLEERPSHQLRDLAAEPGKWRARAAGKKPEHRQSVVQTVRVRQAKRVRDGLAGQVARDREPYDYDEGSSGKADAKSHAPDAAMTRRVQAEALRRHLILLSCGVDGNVLRFLFPLTIEHAVFGEALGILADALKAAARG